MDEEKKNEVIPEDSSATDKFRQVNISKEVRDSFLSYAMSVIVQRALPDARDGMKPVQRRILWGMTEAGITASGGYKKSARIVGDVMGKYHPHGDSSIYEALVHMAQPFSYRYPLIEGHGNFGTMDGDPPAAQRYTEAKMSKISMEMVRDIKKDTVDMIDNYDGLEKEPVVLPGHFPNLLVNGTTGIAVGMATNIPPHNLGEVIDGVIALMNNPEISVTELMTYIKGPDFPTGAQIIGRSGIRKAYETGRGSIIIRSRYNVTTMENGKHRIEITEVPYGVNKAEMVKKIGDLVKDKVVEGITDLKDVSSSEGVSIQIDTRKDIQPEVLLNRLFKQTPLQVSYGINMLAVVRNVPHVMNLKQLLQVYIDHQIEVVTRRTRFDLQVAQDRLHIVEGLLKAIDHIHEIIEIIEQSANDEEASAKMKEKFGLDDIQCKAILDMQVRRLTGLQRQKLQDEYDALIPQITDLQDILNRHERVVQIIHDELMDIKKRFGDERRTEIVEGDANLEDEDLIPVEDIIITRTESGYVKRLTLDTYRTQNRGGRGIKGMSLNQDDVIEDVIYMSSHDWLMLYTNTGRVFRIKGYAVPAMSRTSKGEPIVNLVSMEKDERIVSMVGADSRIKGQYLFFVTRHGIVKRTALSEFESIQKNGKIAIRLNGDDELVCVKLTTGNDEIIIAGSNGKAVHFKEKDVRVMGRDAVGVRGFDTSDGSVVIGAAVNTEGDQILSITENGYGKKSPLSEYRLTKRGGKGVRTIITGQRNGNLVAIKAVHGDEDLLMITNEGIIIRISLLTVNEHGRNTMGVKLINLDEEQKVSSVEVVDPMPDEEDKQEAEENSGEKENA